MSVDEHTPLVEHVFDFEWCREGDTPAIAFKPPGFHFMFAGSLTKIKT